MSKKRKRVQRGKNFKVGNVILASIGEKNRYLALLEKQQAGKITNLEVHPQFVIMANITGNLGRVYGVNADVKITHFQENPVKEYGYRIS